MRTWGGLAGQLTLLQPVVGLFLRRDDLAAAHPRGQAGNAILAGFIASGSGEDRPEIGFVEIPENASSFPVIRTQGRLSEYVSLLGSERKPLDGGRVIPRDILPGRIASAQSELSVGVALHRKLAQSIQIVLGAMAFGLGVWWVGRGCYLRLRTALTRT